MAAASALVLALAGCGGERDTVSGVTGSQEGTSSQTGSSPRESAESVGTVPMANTAIDSSVSAAANVQEAAIAETDTASPADTPLTAEGWGPLTVGMTRAAVTRALGASARPDLVEGAEPEKCAEFHPRRAPGSMIVMLEDDRLTRVSVGRGKVASDRGIRVGDPVGKVRAAYRGASLEDKPHTYQDAPARYLTWWAPGQVGARGIRYEINSDGRVGSIHAGGPSIRYVEGCL